ncbi:MAG TPA: ATP-binding protein [bacterium]|nr:ATP-binding protein [bacterium]
MINSICHRDNAAPESNYIAIYKDRIEIDNPGSFPEGMDPEDFIFKDEQSVLRNPLIADILYKTKDIEKWGSGLKRIFEECREKGIKVEFKKLKTGFRVVFYRRGEFAGKDYEYPETTQKLPRNYPEKVQEILKAIAVNPRITRRELALKVGLTPDGIKYHLNRLKKDGILKRIGSDKGGHWEIS